MFEQVYLKLIQSFHILKHTQMYNIHMDNIHMHTTHTLL